MVACDAQGRWAITITSDGVTDHVHLVVGSECATRGNTQLITRPLVHLRLGLEDAQLIAVCVNIKVGEQVSYDCTIGLMGGGLLNAFRHAVEKGALSNPDVSVPGSLAVDLFQAMNAERSDIIHAYPITNPEGEQILHRRNDSQGKYFEVTDVFLDSFSSRLYELTLQLYAIRKIVRPDLGD